MSDYFDLSESEKAELPAILGELKSNLKSRDKKISGYNIGINVGQDAGQTVMHFHQHLIPRRQEDTEDRQPIPQGKLIQLQQSCIKTDDEMRWLLELISDTGMRLSEAVGLSKADFVMGLDVRHAYSVPRVMTSSV